MKNKKAKHIFIIQVNDGFIRVVKCLLGNHSGVEFVSAVTDNFVPGDTDKLLSEKLSSILKRLDYKNDPLVFSLPRSLVTCRYLKIPSSIPEEIEKIVNLQAWNYLPYPAEELVTGFEILKTDREGYSHVNLVIVHKDTVSHYSALAEGLKPSQLTMALETYGLRNIFNLLCPDDPGGPTMAVNIDDAQATAVVISEKKLVFSRSFKIQPQGQAWQEVFSEEINKTQEAYTKETSMQKAEKIVFIGNGKNTFAPFGREILSYAGKLAFSPEAQEKIMDSGTSFAALLGLALEPTPITLNLLPKQIKNKIKADSRRKEYVRLSLVIFSAFLFWALGNARSIENKEKYLGRLRSEINKLAPEARLLEQAERRLEFVQGRRNKPPLMDLIHELYKVVPADISLASFAYEENGDIILQGQGTQLNSVFSFVSTLANSPVFRSLAPKVKYATQKKNPAGESVDFEIFCSERINNAPSS